MSVKKAVIPAAGLGTRLLPLTKEIPKEMLPLFDDRDGFSFKPLIQIIFERLYDAGVREFCIITGRGKRAIEDHFSQDYGYLALLESINRSEAAYRLFNLYNIIESSALLWINQPKPTGLGAAVLLSEPFIGREPFIVHAGDTYICHNDYLKKMLRIFEEFNPDILFLTTRVSDPQYYGVIEEYQVKDKGLYRVCKVSEKPKKPKTNLVIIPVYIFTPKLFRILKIIKPGVGGEIQLTDAIQNMVNNSLVYALELKDSEDYVDIGKPENYLKGLERSFKLISLR